MIGRSPDCLDWKGRPPGRCAERLLEQSRPLWHEFWQEEKLIPGRSRMAAREGWNASCHGVAADRHNENGVAVVRAWPLGSRRSRGDDDIDIRADQLDSDASARASLMPGPTETQIRDALPSIIAGSLPAMAKRGREGRELIRAKRTAEESRLTRLCCARARAARAAAPTRAAI